MSSIRRLQQLLTLATGMRCVACLLPASATVCASCAHEAKAIPPATDAAFRDMGVMARLVRAAKRGTWRGGGRFLAALVAIDRVDLVPPCDAITWVPADRRRRARRGGHLPERFAGALASLLGVPAIALLEPSRSRRPQRGLDRRERALNVANGFRIRRGRGPRLLAPGTRVLVVDDVRTTGATLLAARSALAELPVTVESFAIVGVDREVAARSWCLESRSDREKSAQDSNHSCRC